MKTKAIVRNVALMVVFGVIGLMTFTENVRVVQVIGLFACGAGFGASLSAIIAALKSKPKPEGA
jgi:hypothetical protein